MHCGLADCQPIGREWSRDSCDYFHSLISKYDPHLRGVIHVGTTVKSFITSLTLYGYSEKKGWISFGHALIEAGHAVTYHNTNTVQYPSTTEATSYDPFQVCFYHKHGPIYYLFTLLVPQQQQQLSTNEFREYQRTPNDFRDVQPYIHRTTDVT